jgi:hypothetical protein
MTGGLHLMNRNGTLYWRRRLGKDIARALKRRHLAISLRTRHVDVAKPAAEQISALPDGVT